MENEPETLDAEKVEVVDSGDPELRPAGFWIRVVAYLVDTLIILIPSLLVILLDEVVIYLTVAILLTLYKPVTEGLLGGTAGKLALGLRVIHVKGHLLGLSGGIVRSGLFILPMISAIIIQLKLFEAGISLFDADEMVEFEARHSFLYNVNYLLSMVTIVSCASVLLNRQKRGLHDLIAQSRVVYHKS